LGDETVSDRWTSVAICAVPQIHSVLIALLDEIQRSLSGEEQVTDETHNISYSARSLLNSYLLFSQAQEIK
jgi:hypothetical protein